ncbi:1068_t:CDS:2 [Racocetra persica]|uniref:1068_t:CDS:1 n=1 Tax=Racocetra persica TaxID=160502 RepID=A0ACA9KMQ9_9GLOM|nr:1068_t:CDS:2 [Racocetra persica]
MHLNYDYALINLEIDFSHLDDCHAFTQFLAEFHNTNLGKSGRDTEINNILREIREILKELAKAEGDKEHRIGVDKIRKQDQKVAIKLLEGLVKED